jgi:hypothetical protein
VWLDESENLPEAYLCQKASVELHVESDCRGEDSLATASEASGHAFNADVEDRRGPITVDIAVIAVCAGRLVKCSNEVHANNSVDLKMSAQVT